MIPTAPQLQTTNGWASGHDLTTPGYGWLALTSAAGLGHDLPSPTRGPSTGSSPSQPPDSPQPVRDSVLLVEDESSLRSVFARTLTRLGYQVLTAADGPEALALTGAAPTRVRLLITDMVMPRGINGYELATRLRERIPGLKVILMSGYTTEWLSRDVPPWATFLPKPFTGSVLTETVAAALAQRSDDRANP